MGNDRELPFGPKGMTIQGWMISIVVASLVLAFMRFNTVSPVSGLGVAAIALILAFIGWLIRRSGTRLCPRCGHQSVGLVAAIPFGSRYLLCSHCGQRMRTSLTGRLWNASGPEFDPYFRKKHPVKTWENSPIEPTLSDPTTKTVGSLLREKRDRLAASGHPVDLDTLNDDLESDHSSNLPNRSSLTGVKKTIAERFFSTLDAIRWTRKPPR
jgi:hypothetical protein